MDPSPHSCYLQQIQNPNGCTQQRVDAKDANITKKLLKADKEKLRRDKLNEQFLELGTTLNPDRPKNDKASILSDAIELLKELTAEVSRLKTEYASLSGESSDLIQEKNELRVEKATLKSDIDNLNLQYWQRMQVMFPWPVVDPRASLGSTPLPDFAHGQIQAPHGHPFMPFPLHPFPYFSISDKNNQYIPYAPCISPVTPGSQIGRPSAQDPSIHCSQGYLMQHHSAPGPSQKYASESMNEQEFTHRGSTNLEFQNGFGSSELSPSLCHSKICRFKCDGVSPNVKDNRSVISVSSSHSSSSGCEALDQPKEILSEPKKNSDSTSQTEYNSEDVSGDAISRDCSSLLPPYVENFRPSSCGHSQNDSDPCDILQLIN